MVPKRGVVADLKSELNKLSGVATKQVTRYLLSFLSCVKCCYVDGGDGCLQLAVPPNVL